jgi:hypothetical protein
LVDVSIRQDRILKAIVANSEPHSELGFDRRVVSAFTPTGDGENSGLQFVMPLSGKDFTATGSTTLPFDSWLVAVRMTSRRLSPTELGEALPQRKAKGSKSDMAEILELTMMETMVDEEEEESRAENGQSKIS